LNALLSFSAKVTSPKWSAKLITELKRIFPGAAVIKAKEKTEKLGGKTNQDQVGKINAQQVMMASAISFKSANRARDLQL
jgi:hypothetical protein